MEAATASVFLTAPASYQPSRRSSVRSTSIESRGRSSAAPYDALLWRSDKDDEQPLPLNDLPTGHGDHPHRQSLCRQVRVPDLYAAARLDKTGVKGRNRIPARERNRTDHFLRELSGGRLRLRRVCPDVARARRANPARTGAQTATSTRWRLCGGGRRQVG